MSRLTNATYIAIHYELQQIWQRSDAAFAELSAAQQVALHTYFCPSRELTNPELLRHRQIISRQQPNLPQRAGRALAQLRARSGTVRVAVPVKQGRVITVHGVLRPEPDMRKLARALLELARHNANKAQ